MVAGGLGIKDLREAWGGTLPEDTDSSNRQILFEGAVLTVLARVLDTGIRIDLAVNAYLASFPIDSDGLHVRPDLIICVSDCLNLLMRGQSDQAAARLSLDEATRLWREARAADRVESDRTITRVQACIGNIRRALDAISV